MLAEARAGLRVPEGLKRGQASNGLESAHGFRLAGARESGLSRACRLLVFVAAFVGSARACDARACRAPRLRVARACKPNSCLLSPGPSRDAWGGSEEDGGKTAK